MPEGHTIHRLAKLHRRILHGRKLEISSPQGRFSADAKKVDGHRLDQITAHGKHLLYEFDNGLSVHVHLGMHGAFRTLPAPAKGDAPPEPIGQVRMRIVGGAKIVELTGPTACEVLDDQAVKKLRARLGPDLLDPKADPEIVWNQVSKRRTPIGALLMDQSIMSGIGNVYRAEVLYRQGVHPMLPGSSLDRKTFDKVWTDSVKLLKLGVKLGHIITVDPDDISKPLAKAAGDDRFLIYRRQKCRRCGGPVHQFTLAGRDCYFCPKEQKLPRGTNTAKFALHPVAPSKPRSRGRNHGDAEK